MVMEKVRLEFVPGDGSRLTKEDAQRYGERIEWLGGVLARPHHGITTNDVVSDARSPDSPLHDAFEWEDAVAAKRYRLEEARYLLRGIKVNVVVKGEVSETRQWVDVAVTNDGPAERLFVAVKVVDKVPELREQVIRHAVLELRSWLRKYGRYEELARQVELVEEAVSLE